MTFVDIGPDTWPTIQRNRGYSPAFLAKIREKRRGECSVIEFRIDETRRFKERGVPEWAIDLISSVCVEHDVSVAAVAGKVQSPRACRARRAAIYALKSADRSLSSTTLGRWFGRDHASVLYALAAHSIETGAPSLTNYQGRGLRGPFKERKQ